MRLLDSCRQQSGYETRNQEEGCLLTSFDSHALNSELLLK